VSESEIEKEAERKRERDIRPSSRYRLSAIYSFVIFQKCLL